MKTKNQSHCNKMQLYLKIIAIAVNFLYLHLRAIADINDMHMSESHVKKVRILCQIFSYFSTSVWCFYMKQDISNINGYLDTWRRGSELDCRSVGQAIDPAPGA